MPTIAEFREVLQEIADSGLPAHEQARLADKLVRIAERSLGPGRPITTETFCESLRGSGNAAEFTRSITR